jgi:hypothetical protein
VNGRTDPKGRFAHTFPPTTRSYPLAILMGLPVGGPGRATRRSLSLLLCVNEKIYGITVSGRKPEVLLLANSAEGRRLVPQSPAGKEISVSVQRSRKKDLLNVTIVTGRSGSNLRKSMSVRGQVLNYKARGGNLIIQDLTPYRP